MRRDTSRLVTCYEYLDVRLAVGNGGAGYRWAWATVGDVPKHHPILAGAAQGECAGTLADAASEALLDFARWLSREGRLHRQRMLTKRLLVTGDEVADAIWERHGESFNDAPEEPERRLLEWFSISVDVGTVCPEVAALVGHADAVQDGLFAVGEE